MSILALAACSVTEENNVSTRDEGYNEDILEEIPSEYLSEQNDTTDIIQDSIEDTNKVDNSINFEEERMVSDDPKKVDSTSMDKTWEEVYKAILCDIDSNLIDPYGWQLDSNGDVYLGIHDFNGDNVPELIIGNGVSQQMGR